jgi:glycosyltransferase involved in cell wall biosynthesis
VPCAELHVYYGFELWWATAMYRHEAWFISWRSRMEALLLQPGIHYHGMVGHQRMAQAYAESGFYVYPTDTPETAPINLIKAQANGCIPVTSRLPASAIPETCGRFDLGPIPPEGAGSIGSSPAWLRAWTDRLVLAMQMPHKVLESHRQEMKADARRRYNWTRVAQDWDNILRRFEIMNPR